ncbi:hypothetical protein BWI96_05030 [Siphonobacter sp. SORGH_AS_0500]|nr:hypothetical protein BWI96_05030 [Siphonobacter sp. SORGH_AS_0500]
MGINAMQVLLVSTQKAVQLSHRRPLSFAQGNKLLIQAVISTTERELRPDGATFTFTKGPSGSSKFEMAIRFFPSLWMTRSGV